MPILNLDALHAALPSTMADDAELNRVLRRIGKIPEWDGATLDEYRTSVLHNRLVVQAPDGRIVKAKPEEFLKWPSEEERLEARRAEERRLRFPPKPKHFDGKELVDEPDFNPFRQHADMLRGEFGPRFDALEGRLADLQELIEAFTPLEIVA